MRVGGSLSIKVDVRVVAATNRDLQKMVKEGTFREDLYFRLKAVSFRLPSLAERINDIPYFVIFFTDLAAKKHSVPKMKLKSSAFSEITNHNWKGNIRELKNFIDMLSIMEAGKEVDDKIIRKYLLNSQISNFENLPIHIEKTTEQTEREIIFRTLLEIKNDLNIIKRALFKNKTSTLENYYLDNYSLNDDFDRENEIDVITNNEKDDIEAALKKYNGNRRKAAESLGMSERTLYRKIQKYEIIE